MESIYMPKHFLAPFISFPSDKNKVIKTNIFLIMVLIWMDIYRYNEFFLNEPSLCFSWNVNSRLETVCSNQQYFDSCQLKKVVSESKSDLLMLAHASFNVTFAQIYI